MGFIFLIFLYLFSNQILSILHSILGYGLHITALESLIQWLMGLPAWFKLNSQLDNALGNFILFILNSWENITSQLTSFEPLIVLFVGVIGIFGFSLQLALIHDILIFCTLHIYAIYRATAYFYHFVLEMVQTFLRLFRGKKYNVLKKRVDSQQFGINQFVLGMILFALFMFLLPTIAVYYSCFGAIFLSMHITEVLLLHLRILYSSFPAYLYYWFMRYKFSVPCGIQMKDTNKPLIIKIQGLEQSTGSYFSIMTRNLMSLWKIWKPGKVIVSVLKGQGVKYLQDSFLQNQ